MQDNENLRYHQRSLINRDLAASMSLPERRPTITVGWTEYLASKHCVKYGRVVLVCACLYFILDGFRRS
jgi:hypothetical protein